MLDHQLDQILHALANTNRRAIIERLADGSVSLLELAEGLTISLTAVVQHVQILERCGLVQTNKLGRIRTCRIEPDTLLAAEDWLRCTLWASHRERLGSLPRDWPWRGLVERPEGR